MAVIDKTIFDKFTFMTNMSGVIPLSIAKSASSSWQLRHYLIGK